MTAPDIRAFRQRWGLSQRGLAELLSVGFRTVQRWEEGTQDIPGPVLLCLRLIDERGALPTG